MEAVQIRDIARLIKLGEGKRIKACKVKNLTAPGENYGSLMLKVDLVVETPEGSEDLHLVAKMLPPNAFLQALFNTDVSFPREITFYKNIFPLLRNFQREHGVKNLMDIAPKYYASRLNLEDDDNAVTADTVLVLENLKIQNYVVIDRFEGMDLEVSKLVLADLAYLHAVPLALKLQKPQIFEKQIKPFLTPWRSIPEHFQKVLKDLIRLVDVLPEMVPLKDKIVAEFTQQMSVKEAREPFATITHNDCWTNNNLVKFEAGKPVKNKMLDFQICSYGSPARDLLFFIFSTVKTEIIETQYDDLIKFYYEVFASALKELNCDLEQFSFDALLKELDYEARNSQFAHVAFMLFAIFAVQGSVKDVSEMTPDNIIAEELSDELKERFVFTVRQFEKRKWIYN